LLHDVTGNDPATFQHRKAMAHRQQQTFTTTPVPMNLDDIGDEVLVAIQPKHMLDRRTLVDTTTTCVSGVLRAEVQRRSVPCR
jgi:hypothetical protein